MLWNYGTIEREASKLTVKFELISRSMCSGVAGIMAESLFKPACSHTSCSPELDSWWGNKEGTLKVGQGRGRTRNGDVLSRRLTWAQEVGEIRVGNFYLLGGGSSLGGLGAVAAMGQGSLGKIMFLGLGSQMYQQPSDSCSSFQRGVRWGNVQMPISRRLPNLVVINLSQFKVLLII